MRLAASVFCPKSSVPSSGAFWVDPTRFPPTFSRLSVSPPRVLSDPADSHCFSRVNGDEAASCMQLVASVVSRSLSTFTSYYLRLFCFFWGGGWMRQTVSELNLNRDKLAWLAPTVTRPKWQGGVFATLCMLDSFHRVDHISLFRRNAERVGGARGRC